MLEWILANQTSILLLDSMLHEIGHNNGLGHAYENHVAYSDMTTVMGYSHRNVVKMVKDKIYVDRSVWLYFVSLANYLLLPPPSYSATMARIW